MWRTALRPVCCSLPVVTKEEGRGLALSPQGGRPSPTPSTMAGPWHPVYGRTEASFQKSRNP